MDKTLLIVDDEQDILDALKRLFRKDKFKVLAANSGQEGLELLDKNRIDIILSDQRMPQMTGSEFLKQVRDKYPETIRIILSGYAELDAVLDAINQGHIYKFLTKPWDSNQLRAQIMEAFKQRDVAFQHLQLQQVFQHTMEGIVFFNKQGDILDVNPALCEVTGMNEETVKQKNMTLFEAKAGKDLLQDILPEVDAKGFWRGEMLLKANEIVKPIWKTITKVLDEEQKIDHYAGLFVDISEQKETEQRLKYQAYHDPLTGLGNKNYFIEQLEFLTNKCTKNQKLAIYFIGLDRFKNINDGFGHSFGDQVLVAVAAHLQKLVDHNAILVRFSGDEFAILHYHKELPQVESLANKLFEGFEHQFQFDVQSLHLNASLGIAIYPDNAKSAKDLLRNASSALYKAKMYGGKNIQYYALEMNAEAKKALTLEADLMHAIEQEELHIVLQPKRCTKTRKILSAEVLLRWIHPTHGFISPGFFIPIAEASNSIEIIGKWVIEQACKAIHQINKRSSAKVSLAVNLSARQLMNKNVLSEIHDQMVNYQIEHQQLEFEITESAIMENKSVALDIINEIKQQGFKLALDDFGTGYSSLSYLKEFPFDVLKVDQSFVRYIEQEIEDRSIVTAIVNMAKGLNMRVVAEGVETEEQWRFFEQVDCDYIQGFLGGKPMKLEEFINCLVQESN